ncbi:LysM peptidoglycan-binding domain-containing protein [Pseudolysinimonas sp.]|uniref:LysM peptidoglycan-binding domain-containing protein n=1 Tax=Pseudolysinimonas sp. TaxID=2680009 RepID=UPI00286D6845|nr:LysM peptidoglycan-binding domain-containing protein [Pseudolysinimonas sp.]
MTAVVSYLPTHGFRPVQPPAAPRLRLSRRGRVVISALAAIPLVIAALVFGLGAGGAVATHGAAGDSLTWVTVDGGQSLWDLAAEIAPTEDPREFAAQVAAFNQLDSTVIQPGQELAIPPQYSP